jgi:RecB family endonuclease NucS
VAGRQRKKERKKERNNLTTRNRVLLVKPTGHLLVHKFPAFYETRQ